MCTDQALRLSSRRGFITCICAVTGPAGRLDDGYEETGLQGTEQASMGVQIAGT